MDIKQEKKCTKKWQVEGEKKKKKKKERNGAWLNFVRVMRN